MGYKSKVDSNSMLGANRKIVQDEVMRKEMEYENNTEMNEIRSLYKKHKIAFYKRVVPASVPKFVAVEASRKLGATWIILDRQMKKDKKYIMENLSCGISRMKRNNSIELLRGPKDTLKNSPDNLETHTENRSGYISQNENTQEVKQKQELEAMFEGIADDDDDLFSLDVFPPIFRNAYSINSKDEKEIDSAQVATGLLSTSHDSLSPSGVPLNPEIILGTTSNDEGSCSKFQDNEHENIPKVEESKEYKSGKNKSQEHVTTEGEILQNNAQNINKDEIPNKSECAECTDDPREVDFKNFFTYDELYSATNGFSKDNFISEGGFGYVYVGRLRDGHRIAVKQHKHASSQGEKEFRSEVNVLRKARHKNVVRLLGSCSEESHRLLVYEYVCNGSLDKHLSQNNSNVLSWRNRLNIALGVARGLNYLHQNNIIHRDMRPNNILINHEFEPLLGDFGLAKTQKEGSDRFSETLVVGTIGYMAPEYAKRGKVSTKTDVYAFGVILLELITGRTPMDKSLEEKSLVGWAKPLLKERQYPELIDERILDCHDVHELFWMVRLAETCLRRDPDGRPSIDTVEDALKSLISGETVTGIEEWSPNHSSDSSFKKSTDSYSEQDIELHNQVTTDATPTSTNQNTLSPPSSKITSSKSLSSLIQSEDLKSGKGKSGKKTEKPRSSPPVLYDEMLDD